VLLPLCAIGQNSGIVIKEKKDVHFFPPKTFYSDKEYDDSGNVYWSNYLIAFNKPMVYKDTIFDEYYRLLHFGSYISIVEVIKSKGIYTIISDSLDNNKIIRTQDTLTAKEFSNKADSLKILVERLWHIQSYKKLKEIHEDDRDNWVIEIKQGTKYHAINRIEAEEDVDKFIRFFMGIGDLHGYKIFHPSNHYRTN